MNIFFLSWDPEEAAKYHCNSHVVKMITESAQMLSTAHWVCLLRSKGKELHDFDRVKDCKEWLYFHIEREKRPPLKLSFVNHPMNIWVRETLDNYDWLCQLGTSLGEEFKKRYKKSHKSSNYINWLSNNKPIGLKYSKLTNPPLCMPNECKINNEIIDSYQNFYVQKKTFAKWEPRAKTPVWYQSLKKR